MWKYAATLLAIGALSTTVAHGQCQPIKGKITNNAHTPAPWHTLGVAAVVFGTTGTKLKCAVHGAPALPPDPTNPASVGFTHTISCDDKIGTDAGPVHSKLALDSKGTTDLATLSFTETSLPIPDSGTGRFQGVKVEGSAIHIKGQIFPTGAVDMEFAGQVCY